MSQGPSLCRIGNKMGPAHLALILAGKVYDLTATGQAIYSDLSAWLRHAAADPQAALADLDRVPSQDVPICDAQTLLTPTLWPRLLAPIDAQEVWACGVTYEMSREARMRESEEPTIYGRVYDSTRPEVFFKATPHRVVGHLDAVGIRADSTWNVPEPELTLLVTPQMHIIGFTTGNDMSSRDIEGQNPLYLPQAKVYDRCCALGPWVRLATEDLDPLRLDIRCDIRRAGRVVFSGQTQTSNLHRPLEGMTRYLGRCNVFPEGVFLMTGTGIVPPDTFTLTAGDEISITIEGIGTLTNSVTELSIAGKS